MKFLGKHLSQYDQHLPEGWCIREYVGDLKEYHGYCVDECAEGHLVLCEGQGQDAFSRSNPTGRNNVDALIRTAKYCVEMRPLRKQASDLLDEYVPEDDRFRREGPRMFEWREGWYASDDIIVTMYHFNDYDGVGEWRLGEWDDGVAVYAGHKDKPRDEGAFAIKEFADAECVEAVRYAIALSEDISKGKVICA